MSKKNKPQFPQPSAAAFQPRGGGAEFSVQNSHTDGKFDVRIDSRNLASPQRAMGTNFVEIRLLDREFNFVFGHRDPFSFKLFAALIVTMPFEEVKKSFFTEAQSLTATLVNFLSEQGYEHVARETLEMDLPERSLVERATFATVAFMGEEAEIYFYRISPQEIHKTRHTNPSSEKLVFPIIRIDLSSRDLNYLLISIAKNVLEA